MKRKAELLNYPRQLYYFQQRLGISVGFIVLLFLLLLARFCYLQIWQYEHYQTLAEKNRISVLPILPNRGLIFDRNGEILAANYPAYTLEIIPSKTIDLENTINKLASIINIEIKDRKYFNKLVKENGGLESLPIRARLSSAEVARFSANHYLFPEVDLRARLFRQYPRGDAASHAIGYIGRINDKDLKKLEINEELANYRGSQHIGKIGIEQSYEKELHGITGLEKIETNSIGRSIRTISRTPPISGNNLTLTLDIKLQEVAEKAFGNRRGALVALDPNNGEVLAFVSRPGFDPNLFVNGIDLDSWNLLNNSTDRPLNNRALSGLYPPGSTFKPFMALAGLELKQRTPEHTIRDLGYFSLPGSTHRFRDWKVGGHGDVNIHKSLVISCDTYYYGLANDLGIDSIHDFISQFGLGKKTGIDIEGEAAGLLPSKEWKMKQYKKKWYVGDTISVGVGQGYNLTTPLQLAFATTILASQGKAFRPRFLKKIQDSSTGKIYKSVAQPLYTLNFEPNNFKWIKDALIDVTQPGGTAAIAGANATYTFAGKTGTSQVVGMKQGEKYNESKVKEHHRDHALFISYAPAEKPSIVLSVLVENGGHGGSSAAPIARQIMDYFLLGKLPVEEATRIVDEEEGTHD
ncbi:MAG: penicillin-binding protein 2 [Nitrosomonadaceae bacterium]|nr:penicillin-binding protein 2 [Nitrosospira sp.]MDW7642983.1 penicillin-binding protein 2 [Nitrosomonadaceae bacterium]MDW7652602.1 penicillin-binding protein 2 [Nitrosomonadaceae bacterium]MDW7663636.1 penicillin-binding protein 2 [Nitrosomonadaceae bacterium]MDW7665450.1 penicillin-binding protein 2 [Nitrosomonadaceae bacterium]